MADPDLKMLEHRVSQAAPAVDEFLNEGQPKRIGFLLVAFEFGEVGGALAYVSNADRGDIANTLRELIVKLEGTSRTVSLPDRKGGPQ